MSTQGKRDKRKQFFFIGEWIPEHDPLKIGEENFAVLENCRYIDVGIEGVLGYSKLHPTAMSDKVGGVTGGYYCGRSGIQLQSPYSGEGRVLLQVLDATLSGSAVVENSATIPYGANFTVTPLHTDGTGAGLGRFSKWPNGVVAYCNGIESQVYGGGEVRCGKFVNYDPDESFWYDFTTAVQNLEDGTEDLATLSRVTASLDANTLFLMHLDGAVTDAVGTHTPTANNITYSSTDYVFASKSAVFNGTTAYITVPDHANFNFTAGTFTIDFRMKVDALPAAGKFDVLYYQETAGTDYFKLSLDENGAIWVNLVAAAAELLNAGAGFYTDDGIIETDIWYHVELVESEDNWHLFVDGEQVGYISDGDRCANYTQVVSIGKAHPTAGANDTFFAGHMDEFRVSNAARHTGPFEPLGTEYGAATNVTYCYVGSTRPIQGIKFYVETANATAGDLNVEYWNGYAWTGVGSLTDGTETVAGTPLSGTGTAAFTDTDGYAKTRVINSILLYWYRVTITDCDDAVELYHVSVDASFQSVKDIWDGVKRVCIAFQVYDASTYNDYTLNVLEEDYSSANDATFAPLNAFAGGGTDYFVAGFDERMSGIVFTLVGGEVNANNSNMRVSYWNGSGWTKLKSKIDGTMNGNKSFGKSGTVTWDPPSESVEFRTAIANEVPLYYYKFQFTNALSATVSLDYAGGIPAPRTVPGGYKFPMKFQNRPLLCCYEQNNEGNRIDYGMADASEVWNGEDSSAGYTRGPLYFGGSGELTCGCELYNRFGSSIYDIGVFCKNTETYVIEGTNIDDWKIKMISNKVGCPAPLTMDTAEVAFSMSSDAVRNIAIWMSYNGPVIFDGATLLPISNKVANYWDKTSSDCINYQYIENARGWVDPDNNEYNLMIPSGAGQSLCNVWLVLDLKKMKWFQKVPLASTTALAYPQCGFRVEDQYGAQYVYGCRDDGYMLKLETGTSWADSSYPIVQKVKTADQIPSGDIWDYSTINKIKLIAKVISEDRTIATLHYQDGETTGTTVLELPVSTGSNRHDRKTRKLAAEGHGYSHQVQFTVATSETEKGVQMLGWGYTYEVLREDD